ncbi:hypothetical protein HPB52_013544 [Rhipicephalus sanguineus]|uniref:Uncharacterized protein n=1 Tax=Rhipicephalus sanguineus TaxID=34632 RepID=A0A9D4PG25_RHISA|nr:hypothetical protein HPB52_013544 [Rhipicephalus sanguineus]
MENEDDVKTYFTRRSQQLRGVEPHLPLAEGATGSVLWRRTDAPSVARRVIQTGRSLGCRSHQQQRPDGKTRKGRDSTRLLSARCGKEEVTPRSRTFLRFVLLALIKLEEAAQSHDDSKPTSSRLSTSAQAVVYVVSHPNFPFCQSQSSTSCLRIDVLRELVRSVVREELQRLNSSPTQISSLAEVVREEVRQVVREQQPQAQPQASFPVQPAVSYAEVLRGSPGRTFATATTHLPKPRFSPHPPEASMTPFSPLYRIAKLKLVNFGLSASHCPQPFLLRMQPSTP